MHHRLLVVECLDALHTRDTSPEKRRHVVDVVILARRYRRRDEVAQTFNPAPDVPSCFGLANRVVTVDEELLQLDALRGEDQEPLTDKFPMCSALSRQLPLKCRNSCLAVFEYGRRRGHFLLECDDAFL